MNRRTGQSRVPDENRIGSTNKCGENTGAQPANGVPRPEDGCDGDQAHQRRGQAGIFDQRDGVHFAAPLRLDVGNFDVQFIADFQRTFVSRHRSRIDGRGCSVAVIFLDSRFDFDIDVFQIGLCLQANRGLHLRGNEAGGMDGTMRRWQREVAVAVHTGLGGHGLDRFAGDELEGEHLRPGDARRLAPLALAVVVGDERFDKRFTSRLGTVGARPGMNGSGQRLGFARIGDFGAVEIDEHGRRSSQHAGEHDQPGDDAIMAARRIGDGARRDRLRTGRCQRLPG